MNDLRKGGANYKIAVQMSSENVHKEISIVPLSNAYAKKGTVMIESFHAHVTVFAMDTSWRSNNVTSLAILHESYIAFMVDQVV
jgi:hypothetical protein